VLFHELAHSLVALAYGIPVRDITLHLFGGVSNIEKEPPTPGAELLMAIVGPIASGPVNIMVGLFNMLPGFPLDGGRVLRAIVWRITGNLEKATRVAGGAGQAVGWLFVVLGLAMVLGFRVPFFGRGVTSGLWLGMIGLFLRNAAVAHLRSAAMDQALGGVQVQDLMRTKGAYVEPRLPIRQLLDDWFLRHDEVAWPVIQNGLFVGIVSIEDLKRTRPEDWATKTVSEVMTPAQKVVSATPDEPLNEALRKLAGRGVRQLPVLEGGMLVGVLYDRDVARWLELRTQVMREPPARVRPA
jgi:CBS domain-containing protein